MLLTRSPLGIQEQAPFHLVRLACIRHAASVHPEPGSNSQCLYSSSKLLSGFCKLKNWRLLFVHLFSFQRSVSCLLLRNSVPSQDCTLEYNITNDIFQSTTFLTFFILFLYVTNLSWYSREIFTSKIFIFYIRLYRKYRNCVHIY